MPQTASLETKWSRVFFTTLMLGVFAVLFGPNVFAHFTRIDGGTGWGYGYGYGFGYGYGWDDGSQAGYQTVNLGEDEEGGPITETSYRFGYGSPNYTVDAVSYQEMDMSGATLLDGISDDQAYGSFALPFTFNFYGNLYNEFYISSNGYITFGGPDADYPGDVITDEGSPNNYIAGAMTDMDFTEGGEGVRYQSFGDAPNRIFVVSYENPGFNSGNGGSDFQIWLYETSNNIEIHTNYIDMPYCDDSPLTQGIENSDGTNGVASPGINAIEGTGDCDGDSDGSFFGYGYAGTYGFGYGYGITSSLGDSAIGWDYSEHAFHIDASEAHLLAQAGIVRGDGDDAEGDDGYDESFGSMDQAMFVNRTILHSGNNTVTVFEGTTVDEDNVAMDTFFVNNSPNTSALTGVKAKIQLGVDGEYAGELIDMDNYYYEDEIFINLFVGESYNGDELVYWVYDEDSEDESDWYEGGTCEIVDGYCGIWHDDITRYAVATGISTGGGSSIVAPSVTVVLPNGGESVTGGGTANVVWVHAGTDVTVRLSYSTNDGDTWTQFADNETGNSVSWNVPYVSTTKALIKAEAMVDGEAGATDVSNANFTIVGPSSGGGGGGGGGGTPSPSPSPSTSTGGVTSGTTNTREQANACLPAGYEADSLVKIPNDGDASTEFDTTVYYLGFDCKRHPFPTRQMYDSWYSDFSGVKSIDLTTLGSIQLGAPIMSRPGTNWVKISSDPRTFYVEPGNKLRWIKDEATAVLLGGTDWASKIIDVDTSLFVLFTAGADISVESLATAWPAATIVKQAGSEDMFYVTPTGRRLIGSLGAFTANHFQARFVETTPASLSWTLLPTGPAITGLEDALFSLMH